MKTTKRVDSILVDTVLFFIFLAFAIMGAGYQPMARQLPLPISLVGCALVFVLLLTDIFPAVHRLLPFVNQAGLTGGGMGKSQMGPQMGLPRSSWFRLLRWICWMVAFLVAMQMVGYLVATGLFLFFITWLEGRVAWWKSLLSAAGTCLFFYVVFDLFLAVSF